MASVVELVCGRLPDPCRPTPLAALVRVGRDEARKDRAQPKHLRYACSAWPGSRTFRPLADRGQRREHNATVSAGASDLHLHPFLGKLLRSGISLPSCDQTPRKQAFALPANIAVLKNIPKLGPDSTSANPGIRLPTTTSPGTRSVLVLDKVCKLGSARWSLC
jgi:hypothetical protein